MRVALIAAMTPERVIGRDNALPWGRLSPDLKRFRRLTMGHPLIVGRRTFESIGGPLPGRRMIVVSRRMADAPPGVAVARSIDEALRMASDDEEAFVAGGAEVYEQTIGRADRLYITLIERSYEGDALFPVIDPSRWLLVSEESHPGDAGTPPWRYLTYERAGAAR